MSKVTCQTLHQLNLEPYSRLVLKQGLKLRKVEKDGEEDKVLDRAMEYTRVVGVEVADMLASVNKKVRALKPCILAQHMFGGNGLQNFIHNHQDHLEWLEDQLGDLVMMTNNAVGRLTGGKGTFTQWAHCEFIVGFETIHLANTHPNTQWVHCE